MIDLNPLIFVIMFSIVEFYSFKISFPDNYKFIDIFNIHNKYSIEESTKKRNRLYVNNHEEFIKANLGLLIIFFAHYYVHFNKLIFILIFIKLLELITHYIFANKIDIQMEKGYNFDKAYKRTKAEFRTKFKELKDQENNLMLDFLFSPLFNVVLFYLAIYWK